MTYIKRMEVQGFKSFAHKTVIDIPKNFNVFVGSNGSGKSNVIDALCFVLGKTSKKSMRADMLTDLIFNGGKTGRPAKFAEVGLIFDNSQKEFPYEGEEFKISRRVLDKGTSMFKINDKPVKKQEIVDSLTRVNVDPDGFNVMLQGDIQRFVDLSPEERLSIIQDVSGISVFEDKKTKSLRELDKVESTLKEARVMLAEKERYLKEIINDKKQAEKFLKMQEELKDKKACLLFKKITELETKVTEFDDNIKVNNESIIKSDESIKKLRDAVATISKEQGRVRNELDKKGDSEQQALAKKSEIVKQKKTDLDNVINNHTRELARIKQRRESISTELTDADALIKKSKMELKDINNQVKNLQEEIVLKRKSSGVNEEERISKLKENLITIEESLSKLSNELLIGRQSADFLKEYNDISIKIKTHETNLSRVNTSVNGSETKREELYAKKREVDEYLTHLNGLKIRLESKKDSMIEYGGRGVRAVIKERTRLPGVHGTIATLGLTDKNFATALSVAAGNKINAIITTDDSCAQKCIEYLRQTQSGTASFIPLNKITRQQISEDLRKLKRVQGVIDFAINLIKFDEKYRHAFELVLKDTLIVHDLNVARSLNNQVRTVTLQGDIVEPTGLMTGGYRGKNPEGFMSEDIDKELTDADEKLKKYKNYITEINDALNIINEEIIKDREEKARLESVMSELKESLNRLKPKIKDATDVDELTRQINELTDKKESIKKELATGIDEKVIREAREELNKLEAEYNKAVILRGTREAELEKVLQKDKDRLTELISELDKESEEFKKELNESKKELLNVNKELADLKKEESRFYKELKDLYDERDKLSKAVEQSEKEIHNLERGTYSVKEKIQDLNIKRAGVVAKLDGLRVAFEEFKNWEPRLVKKEAEELQDEINKLDVMIRNFGPVNMKSLETYKEVETEFEKIKVKTDELTGEKEEILKVITDIETRKKESFLETFDVVRTNFERIFAQLSPGGIAKLVLDNTEEPLNGGVTAIVRPKGKKILTLKSMSGGEKTITALAFIFAVQECSPTPFYIMDEVDAALDKANTEKLSEMLAEYGKKAQFIVVSHNDDLISAANYLYGVSMDMGGISKIVSLQLPS